MTPQSDSGSDAASDSGSDAASGGSGRAAPGPGPLPPRRGNDPELKYQCGSTASKVATDTTADNLQNGVTYAIAVAADELRGSVVRRLQRLSTISSSSIAAPAAAAAVVSAPSR
ncbi:MAG: hypothetical protein U0263_22090 [Polyangiaceae bacterium]